jgi:transcriptional regulator of arginine metabolism
MTVAQRAVLTKAGRQSRIAEMLATTPVRSQSELGRLLAAEGVAVTQATLSRDLEEMGAVKIRRAGVGTVYAVPDEAPGPVLRALSDASDGRVSRLAAELLVSVEASANLVVARTPACGAQLVESASDRSDVPVVVGHVAGLAARADVGRDRDHLCLGLLGDPADGHRGVQPAGVGEDDPLGHACSVMKWCSNSRFL